MTEARTKDEEEHVIDHRPSMASTRSPLRSAIGPDRIVFPAVPYSNSQDGFAPEEDVFFPMLSKPMQAVSDQGSFIGPPSSSSDPSKQTHPDPQHASHAQHTHHHHGQVGKTKRSFRVLERFQWFVSPRRCLKLMIGHSKAL
jgi:hypothetical protein